VKALTVDRARGGGHQAVLVEPEGYGEISRPRGDRLGGAPRRPNRKPRPPNRRARQHSKTRPCRARAWQGKSQKPSRRNAGRTGRAAWSLRPPQTAVRACALWLPRPTAPSRPGNIKPRPGPCLGKPGRQGPRPARAPNFLRRPTRRQCRLGYCAYRPCQIKAEGRQARPAGRAIAARPALNNA
jgi:hypothetical protein